MGLVILLGLAFYVWLIFRFPDALTRWVSTVSIFFTHVQTVALVGSLRLAWPPSVEVGERRRRRLWLGCSGGVSSSRSSSLANDVQGSDSPSPPYNLPILYQALPNPCAPQMIWSSAYFYH